jgi:hypothetical protein
VFPTMEAKKVLNLLTTASQSVSITIPKNEGTYDPNNEDDEPFTCLMVPETYHVKVNEKDDIDVTP